MFPSLAKTFAVIVSSTILATLAVNAVDMRSHIATSWLASVFQVFMTTDEGPCPEGMVLVSEALEPFCVDAYEASPNGKCPFLEPASSQETTMNLASASCRAVSEPNAMPWTYINRNQAQNACKLAGKRLPTAGEWYKAALGTPNLSSGLNEEHCNIDHNRADGMAQTGGGYRCVSDVGAYDMVGNAWEWVDEDILAGVWDGREVPATGFVAGVDMNGVPTLTKSGQDERFASDRFWSDRGLATAAMMRGGHFDGKVSAGVFSIYAASPPSFSGVATGFRCVSEPNSI